MPRCARAKAARWAPWLPAAAWAYLVAGRGRYWSTSVGLPTAPLGGTGATRAGASPTAASGTTKAGAGEDERRWPSVAVVVPARDESQLLPHCLPTLLAQDYPGPLHVVLVDDRSSDGTAQLASRLAGTDGGQRLTVVEGQPLPSGWVGKPWAMSQGVGEALRNRPAPDWFLFTDADIAHPAGSVRQLVEAAEERGCQAVSLMARLSARAPWEKLLMPAFVYFFAQIYPFAWVNDRRRRTAAAAGGCLLVQAEALRRAGGVEAIKATIIDDVSLARALQASGATLWLGLGGGPAADTGNGDNGSNGGGSNKGGSNAPAVKSLRRYPRLADTWDMVARTAYTQLGRNPLALVGALAGLATVYVAPPVLAVVGVATGRPRLAVPGLASWTAMTATYLPMVRYYQAPVTTACALPFTASLYAAMTVSSARRYRRQGLTWSQHRGRGAP